MDEILKEFLIESYENIDRLDRDLVALEKDPHSKETIGSIFRTIHTLKGGSGFLHFKKLEAVAHIGENLLSKLRDELMVIDPEITSALLATVDTVRFMLGEIEKTTQEGDRDTTELIQWLTRLNGADEGADHAPAAEKSPLPELDVEPVPKPQLSTPAPVSPSQPIQPIAAIALPPENMPTIIPIEEAVSIPAPTTSPDPATTRDVSESRSAGVGDSTIRVDIGLLDKLMNLVGELVLARNQVLQFTAQRADSLFLATSQRLNIITTELQESVMKTRMQPIGNVWSKLPRVVRDLSNDCGKLVRLEMQGNQTELDRTIIEAIKDPLTHIIRNSIDHGIEKPSVRIAQGKPQEGVLKMRAYHEGGQVNIEITDDGGGIDYERVKQKAIQKGLINPELANRMSDHEALRLIFLPGFSTAEQITSVSGRGVGMDVVKTNIEKIGGTVDLQSQFKKGTTLKIKIPLTLAIIPALIVTCNGDRFAIAQVSLLELVRLEGEQRNRIEYIHKASVYRLRGHILPLVYLSRELKLDERKQAESNAINIVVVHADGRPFGLVVDDILDTEEIVVKPLGKQLKGVTCFAGATIMGDGRVALILDVLGLAQRARVVAEVRDRNSVDNLSKANKSTDSKQTLLLFDAGQGSHMAIPLSMVARLEEFPASSLEFSGSQEVVRYRGQILPLIRIANFIPSLGHAIVDNDPMQVVVYSEHNRSVGLVVGKIVDIVHEDISVKRHSPGNGIFGSVVIQEKVTDLLDVKAVIRASDPLFYPKVQQAA